ncbi:hypothetical protein L208DRAFT_1412057 [Tricholoma matsutake]|nr:hypothetical protein L208DRAFT_1412057 [Tricholoma matsutake 945]
MTSGETWKWEDVVIWRCEEPAQTGNETHLTYVRKEVGRRDEEIIASSDQGGTLEIGKCGEGISDRWTDHREMAREGGNVRRERWLGVASEFVFGLLGTRDGIDMHEFIETAAGIEENEVMLTNKNTAESKSLRTEQRGNGFIAHGKNNAVVRAIGTVSGFEQETINSVQPWKSTLTHQYPVSVQ